MDCVYMYKKELSIQEGIEYTRRDCVYMYKEGMSIQEGIEYTRRD